MANGARIFTFPRRPDSAQAQERQALLESMHETRQMINRAYTGFNAVEDPDLIEAYVYEINSLQARYSYLLRQVKAMEDQATAAAAP